MTHWFLFRDGRLLLSGGEPPRWSDSEAAAAGVDPSTAHRLERWREGECRAAELGGDARLPDGMEAVALRDVIALRDEAFFRVASQASQLVTWASTHRHCGRCGAPTVRSATERSLRCTACGLEAFPRVSPAVIVAVLREERILLARARRFPPGLYSVLAGFVEAGESLEECVHREIREECGVEVTNLRYFGSQSWPFPHSLMVSFIADWAGGEIRLDPHEIADARWFGRDDLPDLPLPVSIARRMIEAYRAGVIRPGGVR
jgi:NAD+ diphosphatase